MPNLAVFRLLLVAAVITCLFGCASMSSRERTPPSKTTMTSEAEAIFYFLKYEQLKKEGKSGKAVQALQKANALSPAPTLYLELAYYYWQKKDWVKTETSLLEGLEQFPEDRDLIFSLIKFYVSQDRVKQASRYLDRYLEDNPQDWEAYSNLAKFYFQEDKYAKALDTLKKIPKEKYTAQLHYLFARVYSEQNNIKAAIGHLKKAVDLEPYFYQAWYELAYQYELAHDFAMAEKTYSWILEERGFNQDIALRLVELNLKLNNLQKALEYVRNNPGKNRFLMQASKLFLRHDYFLQAEDILQSLDQELYNSDRIVYFRAIIAYRGHDDLGKALNLLQGIGEDSSIYKESLSLRCKLFINSDQRDKALQLTAKGRELFPEEEDFWLLESDILNHRKKYESSKQVLQEGLKHVQEQNELLFQLGVVEYKQGNKKKAIEYMEKIIKDDPDHAQALNFVGYTLAEEERDLDRAKILINKALQLEPNNGYYLDSLAWLYYKTGHLQKAWEKIEEAVANVQDDPIIWEHYADIAKELDNLEKARLGYKKSLQLKPESPEKIREKLKNLQIRN